MQLYVFGNGNLSFPAFLELYAEPLGRLLHDRELRVLVCDFRGADTLVMEYLKHATPNVRVYHVGARPRYLPDAFRTLVGQWELAGGFDGAAARDAAAIAACTHFLAHDFNSDATRKSGTLRNIERCLALGKTRLFHAPAPAPGL
jgi:hypothetical protein